MARLLDSMEEVVVSQQVETVEMATVKAITSQPGKTKSAMARLLDPMEEVVVSQQVETVETATGLLTQCFADFADSVLSFGCCKVETENSYLIKDAKTGLALLAAEESSSWSMRNPGLCCDCVCWCCHSDCSARRPFTLSLAEERGACPVLEMAFWPTGLLVDCLPCCRSITVRAQVAAPPLSQPTPGAPPRHNPAGHRPRTAP